MDNEDIIEHQMAHVLTQAVMDNERRRNPETGRKHPRSGNVKRYKAKRFNDMECRLTLHMCDSVSKMLKMA